MSRRSSQQRRSHVRHRSMLRRTNTCDDTQTCLDTSKGARESCRCVAARTVQALHGWEPRWTESMSPTSGTNGRLENETDMERNAHVRMSAGCRGNQAGFCIGSNTLVRTQSRLSRRQNEVQSIVDAVEPRGHCFIGGFAIKRSPPCFRESPSSSTQPRMVHPVATRIYASMADCTVGPHAITDANAHAPRQRQSLVLFIGVQEANRSQLV